MSSGRPGPRLTGKVCLVTGATRGIGRGVAVQLGDAGATVYITGRTLRAQSGQVGSLEDTAKEIEERGGRCIPIQCDHSNDDDVKKLFERIKSEQNGRLDVLVNNAYSAVTSLVKTLKVPFWEQPVSIWDDVNHVGLRNHYLCSTYAARLMVAQRQGLIVNMSSLGGLSYLFNVAYGVGKAALDRLAADAGIELKPHNVAFISLWPGAVQTELMMDNFDAMCDEGTKRVFSMGAETVEYAGRGVAYMAADKNIMEKTGRVILTTDLGAEYGFVDVNGETPVHVRSLSTTLCLKGNVWLASVVPRWIKIPFWVLALSMNKF